MADRTHDLGSCFQLTVPEHSNFFGVLQPVTVSSLIALSLTSMALFDSNVYAIDVSMGMQTLPINIRLNFLDVGSPNTAFRPVSA